MNDVAGDQVVHVVGARPNFVKAAPVIRALDARAVGQLVIHTGQHHDRLLSDIFFDDLGLAAPDVHLRARATSHAKQLGQLMAGLERELARLRPRMAIVYGDVNSTLAAALVCAHLEIPIAHVEAGLRSFDLSMPEEVNRRVTDVLSTLLFATLPEALDNLAAEGVDARRVHHVGNPMIDTLLANEPRLDTEGVVDRFNLPTRYGVATPHRPSNVDSDTDAARVVAALEEAAQEVFIVLPLHPRGRRSLERAGLTRVARIQVLPPLGYLHFLSLVKGAAVVITDSGGVQEEASMLGVPCLTVRANTERPSTLTLGTNRLVRREDLGPAVRSALGEGRPRRRARIPLWDGRAAERIASIICGWLDRPDLAD